MKRQRIFRYIPKAPFAVNDKSKWLSSSGLARARQTVILSNPRQTRPTVELCPTAHSYCWNLARNLDDNETLAYLASHVSRLHYMLTAPLCSLHLVFSSGSFPAVFHGRLSWSPPSGSCRLEWPLHLLHPAQYPFASHSFHPHHHLPVSV